jgi:predicted amino acid dehydrogenase
VEICDAAGGTSTPYWSRPSKGLGDVVDQQPLETSARVIVVDRVPGTRQNATDAALYILHLQSPPHNNLLAELQAHLGVLGANGGIMLILTDRLLPKPGSITDVGAEAVARSRDLTLLQLANESEMEMSELLKMIDSTRDSGGKLVVTQRLTSRNNLVAALVVKYETL